MSNNYPPFVRLVLSDRANDTPETRVWLDVMTWELINNSPELMEKQREFEKMLEREILLANQEQDLERDEAENE